MIGTKIEIVKKKPRIDVRHFLIHVSRYVWVAFFWRSWTVSNSVSDITSHGVGFFRSLIGLWRSLGFVFGIDMVCVLINGIGPFDIIWRCPALWGAFGVRLYWWFPIASGRGRVDAMRDYRVVPYFATWFWYRVQGCRGVVRDPVATP